MLAEAELLQISLPPWSRLVERRQAVHELRTGGCPSRLHQLGVDLVRLAAARSALPTSRLAHRDPDVGVDEVDVLDRLAGSSVRVISPPLALGHALAVGDISGGGQSSRGAAMRTSQPMIAPDHQQRVAHIAARVAHVGVESRRRACGLFVAWSGSRRASGWGASHRSARYKRARRRTGQLLDRCWRGAAVLDRVEHAARARGPCPSSTPCGRSGCRTGRDR